MLKIALKSMANGKYLCAEQGGSSAGTININRDAVGPWETFTVHLLPANRVALETCNGFFFSDEMHETLNGALVANRSRRSSGLGVDLLRTVPDDIGTMAVDAWESFILPTGDSPVLRGQFHVYGPFEVVAVEGTITLPIVGLEGDHFVSQGRRWVWRGFTDFALYKKYLDGEDISPILKERKQVGANLVRVLGMAKNLFDLDPRGVYQYYDRLSAFVDLVASFGLYCEFVVFADAQYMYAELADQAVHLGRVVPILADKPSVFVELANEPFKNGVTPAKFLKPEGPCFSYGSAVDGMGLYTGGDYCTFHTRRDWKWAVTVPQTVAELQRADGPSQRIVIDEPMGAAETSRADRSTDSGSFYKLGVDCALWTAGGTFHSDAGLRSEPLGPIQGACAVAFFRGLNTPQL